jgi:cell wall-associated NlpC family hydrolase
VIAGPLGALMVAVLILMLMVGAGTDTEGTETADPVPVSCVAPAGTAASLDVEQTVNAATIIAVGRARKVPEYGWIIALATALQESALRNLNYGDRDSLGLFQQRPSQGWGTPAQVRNPRYAATAFYGGPDAPPANEGLLDIAGWQSMPVTVAAQRVQKSGFPDAYAKHEPTARAAVAALGGTGTGCAAAPPASATATRMVQVALAQVGDPYVWGAEGPDGFDCSGLIVYSWQQAGFRLPVRVARDMYRVATPIRSGDATTGDMIFSRFGDRGLGPTEPGHIQIVVRPGEVVEAFTTGQPVRISTYDPDDPQIRFGRFPASALTPIR